MTTTTIMMMMMISLGNNCSTSAQNKHCGSSLESSRLDNFNELHNTCFRHKNTQKATEDTILTGAMLLQTYFQQILHFKIECGPPATPADGLLVAKGNVWDVLSTTRYICPPGYKQAGTSHSIRCLANGSWSILDSHCEPLGKSATVRQHGKYQHKIWRQLKLQHLTAVLL